MTDAPPKRDVVWRTLEDLWRRVDPENAKGHDVPGIVESIDVHGFRGVLNVDERTELLGAGHGRLKAVTAIRDREEAKGDERVVPRGLFRRSDGEWMMPTIDGDGSEDDEDALGYLIADNALVPRGGWDLSVLVPQLERLAATPLGLKGVGIDQTELDEMFAKLNPEAPGAFPVLDPDALPIDYRCPRCQHEWSGDPRP